ncbi:co-chaperone YbbN, partial [Corynebacterium phoceense]|nr:co-chaperone YbbN [Corynebacterium phoceense]
MTIPNRFVGGALDLGELKARNDARAKAASAQQPGGLSGGVQPFFQVTEANFEEDVARRSAQVPVVVLVGTARSPQSEQMKADFSELAAAGGLKFVVGYVDADATPQVAQVFGG